MVLVCITSSNRHFLIVILRMSSSHNLSIIPYVKQLSQRGSIRLFGFDVWKLVD